MSLLEEIRKQPERVRHVMMWLCVVITFSLVGFVWFKSTQEKFVAMLNADEVRREIDPTRFAERPSADIFSDIASPVPRPSGPISNMFSLLKASIIDLLGSSKTEFNSGNAGVSAGGVNNRGGKGLPLSGDK